VRRIGPQTRFSGAAVDHNAPTAGGQPREAGQGLVEFALVAPILILLIMAIFQFAFVLQAQMGLTNAVREAARRAAAAPTSDSGSLGTWTAAQLTGGSGLLAQNVQGFASARVVGSPATTFCQYTINSVTSDRVTVSVRYRYPVFFPLLSFATDAMDGSSDGDWTLAANAQMRLENGLTTPPGATC
jgi:Flp pilus assembly protein TadG